MQIAQHHFNPKTVYKKQRTTGGMPDPKPTDLDMTKHSDYFVWKDTSKRVAHRCDYTVDKKRVNSCVLQHLFLEGVEQPKISPNKPGNAFSDALLMSRFQNFAAEAVTGFLGWQIPNLINGPSRWCACDETPWRRTQETVSDRCQPTC